MVNNDQTSRRLCSFQLATPLLKGSDFNESAGGTTQKSNDQEKMGRLHPKRETLVRLKEFIVEG